MLEYTLIITSFFYLFGHLIIGFYYRTMNIKSYNFPKKLHEKELDIFVHEIKKREQIINRVVSMTDSLNELNLNDVKREDK
ncbi:Motility integral membrane protein [hydrothermal vent metagenome]|uniref:Motility integral membrane protein n=1 Tax=hydrothermal vent metagenome TaxID=652676 RepID=A0A1W1BE72_9ZZZZ